MLSCHIPEIRDIAFTKTSIPLPWARSRGGALKTFRLRKIPELGVEKLNSKTRVCSSFNLKDSENSDKY
jgi:hypothetical protein